MCSIKLVKSLSREDYYTIRFKVKERTNHTFKVVVSGEENNRYVELDDSDYYFELRYLKDYNTEAKMRTIKVYENKKLIYLNHFYMRSSKQEEEVVEEVEVSKTKIKEEVKPEVKVSKKEILGDMTIDEQVFFDYVKDLFNLNLEV